MGSGLRSGKGRRPVGTVSRLRSGRFARWPCVRLREREEGQALVEFALIAPVVLIIVTGILSFGVGLNYWLDMNKAANQGARQAVVNHWPPYCLRTDTSCTNSTSATPCTTVLTAGSRARLQDVVRCQAHGNPSTTICYPGKTQATATIGDPVRVRLAAGFDFMFMKRFSITMHATAAMRLEQVPSKISDASGPTCP
jgi:hypothetical protein